jgi:hypothetical protein
VIFRKKSFAGKYILLPVNVINVLAFFKENDVLRISKRERENNASNLRYTPIFSLEKWKINTNLK